ncbi:hypothetical protein DYB34_007329 [Aphanomyces astaci]|uniref:Uncharacterized protein n=1 Tax=Aphanomyces astaci TaxID=112090 RepID=A0A418C955_APHAT|nr:hypothetical protein DYB34_007329 [Aphanomyces astaci]
MARKSGKKRKATQDPAGVHAANQVTEAEELLNAGSIDQGRALLESVVAKAVDAQVVQVAQYSLAMLHLCSGNASAADDLLSSLGMRHRLHESVFTPDSGLATVVDDDLVATRHVKVVDTPVSPAVWSHVQSKFHHESSPFWPEHRYGAPDVGYFSYAFRECASAAPANCVESWIQLHLLPHVRASFPDKARDIVHAEWWVHSRDQISGHQLHYDTDESRLTQTNQLFYPLVSTVWYLSPGMSAAPTLVMDKMFGQDASAAKGYLVVPKANRLAMFDGRLLHGVVPHFQQQHDDVASLARDTRLTLMVGFWDKHVASNPFNAKQPTANMTLPHQTSTLKWPAHLAENLPMSSPAAATSQPGPVVAVPDPLWVEVPTTCDAASSVDTSDGGLVGVGKYFVPDLAALDADIAGLLAEPTAEDHEWLVAHVEADDVDHPRLLQTLCVLHAWMQRGGDLADSAGDFLLELTAHCPAAARAVRCSHLWASLFVDSFLGDADTQESVDTLAAIAWNVLKGSSAASSDKPDCFHTEDMVEALMAAADRDEQVTGMVCGALAYCLDFVPNRKWVLEGLAPVLRDLYEDQAHDDDFDGHVDIRDSEHAVMTVLRASSGDRKKLLSALKAGLGHFYVGDVRAKFQSAK